MSVGQALRSLGMTHILLFYVATLNTHFCAAMLTRFSRIMSSNHTHVFPELCLEITYLTSEEEVQFERCCQGHNLRGGLRSFSINLMQNVFEIKGLFLNEIRCMEYSNLLYNDSFFLK
jgi:hypothetical protein